jgi:hypothetical protein
MVPIEKQPHQIKPRRRHPKLFQLKKRPPIRSKMRPLGAEEEVIHATHPLQHTCHPRFPRNFRDPIANRKQANEFASVARI